MLELRTNIYRTLFSRVNCELETVDVSFKYILPVTVRSQIQNRYSLTWYNFTANLKPHHRLSIDIYLMRMCLFCVGFSYSVTSIPVVCVPLYTIFLGGFFSKTTPFRHIEFRTGYRVCGRQGFILVLRCRVASLCCIYVCRYFYKPVRTSLRTT